MSRGISHARGCADVAICGSRGSRQWTPGWNKGTLPVDIMTGPEAEGEGKYWICEFDGQTWGEGQGDGECPLTPPRDPCHARAFLLVPPVPGGSRRPSSRSDLATAIVQGLATQRGELRPQHGLADIRRILHSSAMRGVVCCGCWNHPTQPGDPVR